MPVRFIIDQNFPYQAVRGLDWPAILDLRPLATVDPRLTSDHDDWQVFIRLGQRADVDGFITNDAGILELPREMIALSWTRLTLVITDGVGHDPIRATGLLMVNLVQVAKQATDKPAIYVLKPGDLGRARSKPGQVLRRLADRVNIQPEKLVADERRLIEAFRDQRR